MPARPRFVRAITFVLFSGFTGYAATANPIPQPSLTAWQEALKNNSVLHFLASLVESAPAPLPPWGPFADAPLGAKPTAGGCAVAPLEPIDDPAARQLETASGPAGVVDIADMLPAAARALDRFQARVASAGGTMILKSAYRPAAYQQHLQNVWHKWMDELRDNRDPGCQDLRAQVQDEFSRHRLIETQHPVAVSDHTRGIAFDATVLLPASGKLGRRRITLDGLARLAGLRRPAIANDPVHFKYTGGTRTVSLRRPHNA